MKAPGEASYLPAVRSAPPRAPVVVKVDFRVLTQADGTGNPLWTEAFATRVLIEATSLSHSDLRFELATYAAKEDEALFNARSQEPLLAWLASEAFGGRLSVLISNPLSKGSTGLSLLSTAAREPRAFLVMRSRKNKGSDADVYECASILLHELGHNFGYSHDGTSAGMPFPADAWWILSQARERARVIAGWLELHARGAPPSARDAFECKVGAPQPDTNQLFDPTSAADH